MGPMVMSAINAEGIISEFIIHYQPNLNLIKGRIKSNLQIYIAYHHKSPSYYYLAIHQVP